MVIRVCKKTNLEINEEICSPDTDECEYCNVLPNGIKENKNVVPLCTKTTNCEHKKTKIYAIQE